MRYPLAAIAVSTLLLALGGCGSCSSGSGPSAGASAEPVETSAAPLADVAVDVLCGHMFDLTEMDDPDPDEDKAELAKEKKEFLGECVSVYGAAKTSMPAEFSECANCFMRAKRPEQAERCEDKSACTRVSGALDGTQSKGDKKKRK